MLFSSLLERFIEKSPIAVMAHATICYALNAQSEYQTSAGHLPTQFARGLRILQSQDRRGSQPRLQFRALSLASPNRPG